MKERKAPKFAQQIWGLVSVVLAFVVLGVTQVYGIDIMADTQATQTVDSAAYNASGDMITATAVISDNASNVTNIVMAGVVISIILAAFGGIALYRGMR